MIYLSCNTNSPTVTTQPLLPPTAIWSIVWLVRRANALPHRVLRPMISRTRRRWRKLYRLELCITDDPQTVEVLHQLEIGAASCKGLTPVVVYCDDVVQHEIPGTAVESWRWIGRELLIRAQWTPGRLGRRMGTKVTENVSLPLLSVVKRLIAVENVEKTHVPRVVGWGSISWNDKSSRLVFLEDSIVASGFWGHYLCIQCCNRRWWRERAYIQRRDIIRGVHPSRDDCDVLLCAVAFVLPLRLTETSYT